jgi:hypothetical protein
VQTREGEDELLTRMMMMMLEQKHQMTVSTKLSRRIPQKIDAAL